MKGESLIGKKFGCLTVVEKADTKIFSNGLRRSQWLCKCDCGGVVVKQRIILNRNSNHGCKQCESNRRAQVHMTHGGASNGKTRLYTIWRDMRKRCENPNATKYHKYGGVGIKVCPDWGNFSSFRDWALSNGYSDNLSIDRIDNSKGYFPENCRWSDCKTQSRNREYVKWVVLNGEKVPVAEAERRLGLAYATISSTRIRLNVSHQEAVDFWKNKLAC